jgi:hypothetical protein
MDEAYHADSGLGFYRHPWYGVLPRKQIQRGHLVFLVLKNAHVAYVFIAPL